MNFIHKSAVIEECVVLGESNYIGPYTLIAAPCVIGNNNWITGASIGFPAEHRAIEIVREGEPKGAGVIIGDDNIIREYVTINSGVDTQTEVGNSCYLMTKCHLGHDAKIGHEVSIACGAIIGGRTIVGQGTNIGLNAVVHQNRIVGSHVMIGMLAAVTKEVPDYSLCYGVPARIHGANRRKMLELGITEDEIDRIEISLLGQSDT